MKRLLPLILLAAGCPKGPAAPEAAQPRAVRCERAELSQVSDEVRLQGTVAPLPDRDAQVAPQVPGRILAVLAREGDRVTQGQTVARLDDAQLNDEANAAEAALNRAKAEHKNAQTTMERIKRVFEHGIAARQELDDATAKEAATGAAEAEADATFKRARRQVERAQVKSPLAGVVVKLFKRSGELVDGTPATPVMEVADPSVLELVADAAASDLVRLKAGQRASVTVAALAGQRWEGKVSVVSPAVDRATGLGVARIALELDGGTAPPIGVLGAAGVALGEPREAVTVPQAALRASLGQQAEVVLCEAKAKVVVVQRGAASGGRVAVEGLDAGQRVVVEPVLGVADGDPLAPEEADGAPK